MFDIKSKDSDDEPVPSGTPLNRLVIWLAILGLGICFMPVMLISTTLRTHQQTMLTQMADLDATLTAPAPLSDAAQDLSKTLIEKQTTLKQLNTLQTTLEADYIDWVALMGMIGRYNSATLTISSLSRSQRQMTLNGQGIQEADVIQYVDGLRTSDLFDQVTIQSMVRTSATATPVVLVTATPAPQPPAAAYQVSFVLILTVKAKANQP